MKDALKRLLREANESPRGTTSLQGEEGLTATLEDSLVGEARMIRVSQGFQEIHWSFLTQAGEGKPHFFPEDLPYLPETVCSVVWTEKGGLTAFWVPPSSPDTTRLMTDFSTRLEGLEVPAEVEEFLTKATGAGKEAAKGLGELFKEVVPGSFMERARDAAKGLFGDGLSPEAQKITDAVSTFLEDGGWRGEEEPSKPGHFYTRTFTKGESRKKMMAVSMFGISTVVLSEK